MHPHDENETDLEIEEMETLQEDDFQVEIHISDMEEDIEGNLRLFRKVIFEAGIFPLKALSEASQTSSRGV